MNAGMFCGAQNAILGLVGKVVSEIVKKKHEK